MDTSQIISVFIEFFRDRDHRVIEGSSLLPRPGDPVLYTTSGMHPLTPYLEGAPHPLGRLLTGVQRCLRTTDLDEVGDRSHLTVFQMLGSWSLGEYGGPQSLRWGLELLCEGFGLERSSLYATAFGGDEQVGPDTAALATWHELGLPVEQGGAEDNWWSNGPTGPCGPDSEIFGWTGDGPPVGSPSTDSRWVELWNHVTMRYRRHENGSLSTLEQPSVDTGMGLERLVMVVQGVRSVFETDLFSPWRSLVPGPLLPGRLDERSLRIVIDHLRSAIVVIGDGVRPSNTGRGYVLRRLVRRALTELWRYDGSLSLTSLPSALVLDTASRFGQSVDPALVTGALLAEEAKFRDLLERGRSLLPRLYPSGLLTESDYRYLHETHGLPRELVSELVTEMASSTS
ncbi:MAG TPA: alanine--tRNA ligase-related protein [Streptosporangiaceae bacterium]